MVDTIAAQLGEIRGSTSTGLSLTTTAVFASIPPGTQQLFFTARNFATAVVARVAVNPWLCVLKTTDALATAPTNYSSAAQDGDTATDVVLSSLDTAANNGFLYVGAHRPFGGVSIDVDAANGNASVLTVNYWNGTVWTTTSATDGTTSGGATFAVDGAVTWTTPTDWVANSLTALGATATFPGAGNKIFWTRWQVSAALDSSTTFNSMLAKTPSSSYFELISSQSLEMAILRGSGGEGSIEALTDAGTANLVVNFAAGEGRHF